MSEAMYQYLNAPPTSRTSGVPRTFAIGKFDGIHLAHQDILRRAVRHAQRSAGRACMFTFTPHPRWALSGDEAYRQLLTPLSERARVAVRHGVDEVFVVEFDVDFREQSAAEFVEHYLVPLRAEHVVVGFDFRLGRRGAYGVGDLQTIAAAFGITVEVVEPITWNGNAVSSSLIREHLASGEPERAWVLLGRPYRLAGRVVHGRKRGRDIGFPTVNLELNEPFVIPRTGVYVGEATVSGFARRAAVNIGYRPTTDQDGLLAIEAHLLDFDDDVYGREISLDLFTYVRPERKFDSLSDLTVQLQSDVKRARCFRAE